MASVHHPLLGDEVYGSARCPYKLQGQTLHAQVLGFVHPRTNTYMEFEAPLPEYFQDLFAKITTLNCTKIVYISRKLLYNKAYQMYKECRWDQDSKKDLHSDRKDVEYMVCKTIITIGRQYGSAGREIGEKLASELGIKCYDKELLERAAEESGMCKELFENHDEKPTNSFLYSLVMDTYSGIFLGCIYGYAH